MKCRRNGNLAPKGITYTARPLASTDAYKLSAGGPWHSLCAACLAHGAIVGHRLARIAPGFGHRHGFCGGLNNDASSSNSPDVIGCCGVPGRDPAQAGGGSPPTPLPPPSSSAARSSCQPPKHARPCAAHPPASSNPYTLHWPLARRSHGAQHRQAGLTRPPPRRVSHAAAPAPSVRPAGRPGHSAEHRLRQHGDASGILHGCQAGACPPGHGSNHPTLSCSIFIPMLRCSLPCSSCGSRPNKACQASSTCGARWGSSVQVEGLCVWGGGGRSAAAVRKAHVTPPTANLYAAAHLVHSLACRLHRLVEVGGIRVLTSILDLVARLLRVGAWRVWRGWAAFQWVGA